jgi:hypothetical protein
MFHLFLLCDLGDPLVAYSTVSVFLAMLVSPPWAFLFSSFFFFPLPYDAPAPAVIAVSKIENDFVVPLFAGGDGCVPWRLSGMEPRS